MDTAQLMAVGEAARRLGLSVQRVRQLADAGRLPVERGPLNMRLLRRDAVEHLAREREERERAGRR